MANVKIRSCPLLYRSVNAGKIALTFCFATTTVQSFGAPPLPRRTRLAAAASVPLFVSELHVPGYAETKLPFVLPDHEAARTTIVEQPPPPTECHVPFEDGYLIHKTFEPILTSTECDMIVEEAEQVASRIAWTTNRHGNFPTTDLPLVELPRTLTLLRRALVERIYPALRQQFASYLPDPTKLRVADGFVVKYDSAAGQSSLKAHRDGSVLSFNIALNRAHEYEGGGTWFASFNDAIRLEQGQMVSHASGLLHGGHGITMGRRYILVAFVILEEYDSWSMRFYNQVRNL
jgi:hypothetical protein